MGSLSKPGRGNSTFPLAILTPVMPVLDNWFKRNAACSKRSCTYDSGIIRGNRTVRPIQDHREVIDKGLRYGIIVFASLSCSLWSFTTSNTFKKKASMIAPLAGQDRGTDLIVK